MYKIEAKLSKYCHVNERMAQYIEEYQSIYLRLQEFKKLPEYKLFLVYASIGVFESLETFMVAYENAYNTSPGAYRNGRIMINELISKGDTKSIWDKLQKYLPLYSLFQADRKNSDGDSEVQDPLKEAVKAILQDGTLRQKLDEVAASVVDKLQDVSARTLAKLQEMSPYVASTLTPVILPAESLKWADVFKSVSIAGDESIPINKRGSGTKRLILMNFFRAEVERRQAETTNSCVIYAIEEPETSQHYGNQRKLVHALQSLAQAPNTQIIITTHSATIVKELGLSNIRIIRMDHDQKVVEHTLPSQLPYPSLNEVNYLAFGEVSEEYHNELYGYLGAQNLFNAYKQGKPLVPYTRVQRNGNTLQEHITMTEYIRHQIHHPKTRIILVLPNMI